MTMQHKDLVSAPWADYALIDSGENKKLERYGSFTIERPEAQAIWKTAHPGMWSAADASYVHKAGKGAWRSKKNVPESWKLQWNNIAFSVRLTDFKHTGVFPEQAPNWEWIQERCKGVEKPNVLNLFGYTGIASLAAVDAGAFVTHVDASNRSVKWAKENAELSGAGQNTVRWIVDDASKFAKREVRRGAKYDGIILDPPAFGRGTKGEVWKIEEDLRALLETAKCLLAERRGSFMLLNGYAAGYSAHAFKQLVEDVFGDVRGEFGELHIEGGGRIVPSGIFVRFIR